MSYGYNNAHQLTKITNALGETANFSFNSAGNLTQTLWKTSGGTTKRQHTATYDALGRLYTDVGGQSQTTTYGYDSQGNVTKITDPLSHVTNQTFDALNRLKTSTNAVKDLVQFAYNAHDLPLTVTDGKGNATSFVYDGFNEAIQQISPDSGTTVYWFDKDGNLSKASAFATSTYTYDALDRLLTRTYPADTTLNASLTYDQATGHGSGVGRLTSLTDQAGSLSLSWDQRGLLTSNARTIGGTVYTTGFSFQSAGRLASITYPTAGWTVNYGRDAAGQVSSMTDKPPSSAAVNIATSITHMPFGPVASFTYGNGITDVRTFDLDYRMTSVKDAATGNIQYLSYGYNAGNNVTGITDNVTTANNQTLTYDAIDRLASATGNYGTIGSITYDSNSNRKTYGSTTFTVPSSSDKISAAGATSISYSSTGNISAYGGYSFTYNKANQVASSTVSSQSYTYDVFGQRLSNKYGTNSPILYAYDQAGNRIGETNNPAEINYAWLDGFPISIILPGSSAVYAIHTDRLGTQQKVTDSTKALVWNYTYSPNGVLSGSGSLTTQLRYPGQGYDNANDNHNGFRDYMQSTGRYMQVDPIGLAGGINPYSYARSNTYRFTDPSGRLVPELIAIGLTGVILFEDYESNRHPEPLPPRIFPTFIYSYTAEACTVSRPMGGMSLLQSAPPKEGAESFFPEPPEPPEIPEGPELPKPDAENYIP